MNTLEKLHRIYPSLYGKSYIEDELDERYRELIGTHRKLFSKDAPMLFSSAGRSEIAGNHTDHNGGKVIGAAINLDTIAAVSKRDDRTVILSSEGFPTLEISLDDLEKREDEKNSSTSILRGIAYGIKKRGYKLGGFEANTTTRVLKGSGLSSSAAFEVLIAKIFSSLYNDDGIPILEIAQISKEAENDYFGKPSGLLDQLSCAEGCLTLFDFKDEVPSLRPLYADFSDYGYQMIITDTKASHEDLTDEYSAVPEEMRAIAAYYGRKRLVDVDEDEFFNEIARLRESIKNDRAILRAIHFFEENKRVNKIAEALENKDIDSFLHYVRESGKSSFEYLQNVYSPKDTRKQSLSLALSISENYLDGKGAVRVHGGGFAGTIQAYVPLDMADGYIKLMERIFGYGCSSVIEIRKAPVTRIL